MANATMDADKTYFESYNDAKIHSLMLKDEPRTSAYEEFIRANEDLFKDKVVLDVGSGTGILSLFCARAGAKKVIAVEASGIASLCREVVKANNFDDVIDVIHGAIEDLDELPVAGQVDIIVSEWMGFYLLHEAMLDAVLHARDKWLKPDGLIFPSVANLYVAPVSMKAFLAAEVDAWRQFRGFNFAPLRRVLRNHHFSQPAVTDVTAQQLLAPAQLIVSLDLKFVEAADLQSIQGQPRFECSRNGLLHGFAFWFDVVFDPDTADNEVMTLSTGPHSPATHWKQTVVFVPSALLVSKADEIECAVKLAPSSDNKRHYDITIAVEDYAETDDNAVEILEDNDMSELILSAFSSQHDNESQENESENNT